MKKDMYFFIGAGVFIQFVAFIAGIVITIIGGNDWEIMRESSKIMMAAYIDWLALMFGVVLTVGSAIVYNILEKHNNKETG